MANLRAGKGGGASAQGGNGMMAGTQGGTGGWPAHQTRSTAATAKLQLNAAGQARRNQFGAHEGTAPTSAGCACMQAGWQGRRQAGRGAGRQAGRLAGRPAGAPVAHGVLPQHVCVVQHLDDVGKQLQQAAVLVARHLQRAGSECASAKVQCKWCQSGGAAHWSAPPEQEGTGNKDRRMHLPSKLHGHPQTLLHIHITLVLCLHLATHRTWIVLSSAASRRAEVQKAASTFE